MYFYSLECMAVLLALPGVEALPRPEIQGHESLTTREQLIHLSLGSEQDNSRVYFAAFTMLWIMVLSMLLGSRFGRLRRNAFKNHNITSILVLFLYFVVILFVLIMSIMVGARGLNTYRLCKSTFWVCVTLYSIVKITVYTFLVERIRVVRAPFVTRRQDWMYIGCMTVMVLALSAAVIYGILHSIIEFDAKDGRCHLGIPGKVSIATLIVDILFHLGFTACFFYLLLPVVKAQNPNFGEAIRRLVRKADAEADVVGEGNTSTATRRTMRCLIRKNLIGSMTINLPLTGMVIYFTVTEGRGTGLVCCSLCLLDACWDAIIIYWLTFGSIKAENDLHRYTYQSQRAGLGSYHYVGETDHIQVSMVEEPEIVHSPRMLRRFSDFAGFRKSTADMVVPVKLDCKG